MPHKSLDTYRQKRQAGATPEPFGDGAVRPGRGGSGVFVVQLHAARNRHYDLRIEVGGVLKSWAVPKGPSLDPQEKRYAIVTEDHPLEYADFEGVIPAGNYGAGEMVVWDRGLCVPHIDHAEGLEEGKLLFDLRGYKLRGLWTLVRTKNPKEWLWMKKPDAFATGEDATELGDESVFSGLTVEDLRHGHRRADAIRQRLEALDAPRQRVTTASVKPMLCELRHEPFSADGWFFEIKYDGYRLLGEKRPAEDAAGARRRRGRFVFRSGTETAAFPDLARALTALPFDSLVLDGEAVVLDAEGKPSFSLLGQRAKLTRPLDIQQASMRLPAHWFVFDLLGFEDFDLRPLPYVERKALLREILPRTGPLAYVDSIPQQGEQVFEGIRGLSLEGMVGKKGSSPYVGRRSDHWLKVRADRSDDFAIVGYQLPEGSRNGFRALHFAHLTGGGWRYVGKVGSGFSEAKLASLRELLDAQPTRDSCIAVGEVPGGQEHVWLEPRVAAEIRYMEITHASGHLRHPVFLRLRPDKRAEDCVLLDGVDPSAADSLGGGPREGGPLGGGTHEDEPVPGLDEPAAELEPPREVPFTNLTKVYWPDEGYTKGDLIEYYRAVSPWLLPYLDDRPVVLDRYPDGIHGKSFFQKNAPDFAPDWLRTESIWSEESGDETLYFLVDNVESLLYLANLGSIPLHMRSSRFSALQAPDWCILDLDAKESPFAWAVEVALEIHRLCQAAEMPCHIKTSGATGLHVLLPLGGQCTHAQARQLGELLAQLVAERLPDKASTARTPAMRKGRIYVDFLQNGYGKLLVAPFSVRPRPGAPVSMPLLWDEVGEGLDPKDFTIRNAVERLEALGEDPFRAVLETSPPLVEILGRLAGLVG